MKTKPMHISINNLITNIEHELQRRIQVVSKLKYKYAVIDKNGTVKCFKYRPEKSTVGEYWVSSNSKDTLGVLYETQVSCNDWKHSLTKLTDIK